MTKLHTAAAAAAHSATKKPTYADVVRKRPFEAVLAWGELATPAREALAIGAASDSTDSGPKRPRGRPPIGAVLDQDGKYVLSPESIEVAAQRLTKHREQCRKRYRATRDALRAAKPELFKNDCSGTQQNLRRFECAKCDGLSEGVGAEGHQGMS